MTVNPYLEYIYGRHNWQAWHVARPRPGVCVCVKLHVDLHVLH